MLGLSLELLLDPRFRTVVRPTGSIPWLRHSTQNDARSVAAPKLAREPKALDELPVGINWLRHDLPYGMNCPAGHKVSMAIQFMERSENS